MPTDDAHPPSGVHPSMVAATGLHQPRGFRSPASASSPGLDEDDFGAVSDTMPRFDDVEEYEEVEEEDEVEVVEAAEADVDDEDDVEVEEGYDDLNEAPSTESDSGPEDMPAVASEPKPRGKRYPCTFSECDKVYKNPGGLKYHLAHSHPDPETALIPPGLLGRNGKRGKNVPDIYKPYRCLVLTCGKRYKNLNGLVGLIVLGRIFQHLADLPRSTYHLLEIPS